VEGVASTLFPGWGMVGILALVVAALLLCVRLHWPPFRRTRRSQQSDSSPSANDELQAELAPRVPARMLGLAVSAGCRPAQSSAAGGDFYDVFAPARGKVAVILGDVAGRGPLALRHAASTRTTLRAYVQAGVEPRAALALAGRVLATPTVEHLATAVVGVYDTRSGCLTFASAGHQPPLLHGLHTREPVNVCASAPIGWSAPTGRRQTTVSLPAGAVACFFSDGLVEARCKHGVLGRERLSTMLGSLGARPSAAKLLAQVQAAACSIRDDLAACILVSELAVLTPQVHVEELEVDAEGLDGERARLFLETCQLRGAELEQTLEQAAETTATWGAAVLRVQIASSGPSATVLAPMREPQMTGALVSQTIRH